MGDWRGFTGGSWLLPTVLGTTAGAVDVIGFLALGGLFTAHITGNLVVLAAHYVTGGFSQVGPLLSVPVFITVLGVVTLAFEPGDIRASRRVLLILHAALLAAFFGFAVGLGPFANADRPAAVFVGMLGVAAMATQDALVRLTLPGSASTAVLTTNTTQLTIALATLVRGRGEYDELARARNGVHTILPCITGFVSGCAAGAFLEVNFHLWALGLPVILAALAIPLGEVWNSSQTMQKNQTQRQERLSLFGTNREKHIA